MCDGEEIFETKSENDVYEIDCDWYEMKKMKCENERRKIKGTSGCSS